MLLAQLVREHGADRVRQGLVQLCERWPSILRRWPHLYSYPHVYAWKVSETGGPTFDETTALRDLARANTRRHAYDKNDPVQSAEFDAKAAAHFPKMGWG